MNYVPLLFLSGVAAGILTHGRDTLLFRAAEKQKEELFEMVRRAITGHPYGVSGSLSGAWDSLSRQHDCLLQWAICSEIGGSDFAG